MSRLSLARATDADWADIITTDARAFAMRNPLPDDCLLYTSDAADDCSIV